MRIVIKNLTFNCIIGILPFERSNKQEVNIDISFKYKYENSSTFIDYSKIVKKVEQIMQKQKFELLEEAIIYLEKYFYKKYKIKILKIKISKPNILTNCIVSLKNY
jgi:dihydroneopterin aldolase